jgi:UDP-N-acetylglucosamine 4,6-dehydratase/5-epimerase
MKVVDIAKVIAPNAKHKIIGIRPGEKLHEQMIGKDDSYSTYEYPNYYKILPQINEWGKDNLRIKKGKKAFEGLVYSSDKNSEWMTKSYLQKWIDINKNYIGKI